MFFFFFFFSPIQFAGLKTEVGDSLAKLGVMLKSILNHKYLTPKLLHVIFISYI